MTEAIYWKKVQKYADTEGFNGALLAQLRTGFDKWNVIFLNKTDIQSATLSDTDRVNTIHKKQIINKLETKVLPLPTEKDLNTEGYRNDATSTDLAVRMRHLIGVKRSLSNQFFDVQDNVPKCKELSQKILAYERDIEALREQLRYYNAHGALPPEPTVESGEFIYPTTKYDIDKMLQRTRSMISQVKAELDKLAVEGNKPRIKEREKRLVELKIRKEELEKRLKNANDAD